jgi:N-acetyltransferase 10
MIVRYAVDEPTNDWGAAEKQIAESRGESGKTMIVSVKGSGTKRKAAENVVPEPQKKKKSSRHKK